VTTVLCPGCGHLWFEEGGPGKCVRCGGSGVAQRAAAVPRQEFVAECLNCPAVRIFQGGIVTYERPRPLVEWQAAIHRRMRHEVRTIK